MFSALIIRIYNTITEVFMYFFTLILWIYEKIHDYFKNLNIKSLNIPTRKTKSKIKKGALDSIKSNDFILTS